jgi:histidinol-phosphate/aromatic aminotransferase/cobyric acid decarboxylase-like protein
VAAALGVDPADILDLSASLNPLSPGWGPLALRHLDGLTRYPQPARATSALAEAMGIDPDRLLLTNGGAEAIWLVADALGGHVEEPEFALHPRGDGPRWRSNPHNPSGRLAGLEQRAGVWDEAFYPLATGRWTRGDTDGVVVGSLTKLWACPGLRVGYVMADPSFIQQLARRQVPWSLNGLAAAMLPEMLSLTDLPSWAAEIARLRGALVEVLVRHDLDPAPSDANWVLCCRAAGLRERLIPQGVVVRDCTSFGLPGQARVAVPDPPGLARLAGALERSTR